MAWQHHGQKFNIPSIKTFVENKYDISAPKLHISCILQIAVDRLMVFQITTMENTILRINQQERTVAFGKWFEIVLFVSDKINACVYFNEN